MLFTYWYILSPWIQCKANEKFNKVDEYAGLHDPNIRQRNIHAHGWRIGERRCGHMECSINGGIFFRWMEAGNLTAVLSFLQWSALLEFVYWNSAFWCAFESLLHKTVQMDAHYILINCKLLECKKSKWIIEQLGKIWLSSWSGIRQWDMIAQGWRIGVRHCDHMEVSINDWLFLPVKRIL